MRRRTTALILALVYIFTGVRAAAEEISAEAAILTEQESGRVLFEKNSERKLPMASTTKIMTAVVVLESDKTDKDVRVSKNAASIEGSSMYLQEGEVISMMDLLYGLMLSSGNDAAVAIAEEVSGSEEEFAKIMNNKAKEIGMSNSNFTNPNGLPNDEHYSTAVDMAKLCAYAMKNEKFRQIVSSKNYKIDGEGTAYPRILSNHNKLLSMYEGCVGVKTGYTKLAGRCLVSAAKRENMTLVCVTLNDPNDWQDHTKLFDYGFSVYKNTMIANKNIPLGENVVNGSGIGMVPFYAEEDMFYPIAEGEGIEEELILYPDVSAPLESGECVGKAKYKIRKSESGAEVSTVETELVVRQSVEKEESKLNNVSFFDGIRLMFGCWLRLCV